MTSISGMSPITAYLSIEKNEPAQVASYVKSDPALSRTVAAFTKDIVSISGSAQILSSKNLQALTVVLGAYNLSGSIGETGLLNQLLKQNPSASGSLVRSLGNTDDLNFVQAMAQRPTVSLNFGNAAGSSMSSSGSAASTVSMANLQYASANSALTAAAPAQTWSYLLDDGSATASITAALTTALQATGTTTDPVTGSYSLASDGSIVGTPGAPPVVTGALSSGSPTFSIVLAKTATGATLRQATIVAVAAPTASTTGTQILTNETATGLLSVALASTGFNTTVSANGTLNIINPGLNGPLSLSQQTYSTYATTAAKDITDTQTIIPLGVAGLQLQAGDVLMSGGSSIGTIASIDKLGNATLTAASSLSLAAGAQIDVAVGAGISNIGTTFTAAAAVAAGSSTIALGSGATLLQPGQILTDGSAVLGTVQSVDAKGNVTLESALASAIKSGDTLQALPVLSDTQTNALSDASNVSSILKNYEATQYETQQGQQIAGMDSALYFSRTIGSVTSIAALMADPTLLRVVTTNLGVSDTYSSMPYDQQVSYLTANVKLSNYKTTAGINQASEQFLALTAQANASAASSDGSDTSMLSILYPGSGSSSSTDPILSALYPSSSSGGSSGSSDPLLALFS
ncbi:DUF1217 domain-containing protein [Lichenicoccus sp.]|uniref:DUF1217 domain-containing protein n=1 Tax=Lichenicoccus sp. TaxID=2781899 RepID=UPI003D0E40EB